MEFEDRLIHDIAQFRYSPAGYVNYAIDWAPGEGLRTWQLQEMLSIEKHLSNPETRYHPYKSAIASGHGIGKSAFMAFIALWGMSTAPGCRGIVTANTDRQLRTKTWAELEKWQGKVINAHWMDPQKQSLRIGESSENWVLNAIPWSEKNSEAFAGEHNKGSRIIILMDEGSAIADVIFEVIEGAMTDEGTEIIWLVFGNPTRNIGHFRECFRRYRKWWHCRQIDSRTVEGTNKKVLDEIIEKYGPDSDQAKVRVKGKFPSKSTQQLISQEIVDGAVAVKLKPDQYSFAPKIIGVDPAWDGVDDAAIVLRQGLWFEILEVISENTNDIVLAQKVAYYDDLHKADAVNIDFGFGTGIYSWGRTNGRDHWEIFSFAAKGEFGDMNLRATMWRRGSEWLPDGGRLPDNQQLQEELMSVEKKPTNDGKLLLYSKKEMKAKGLMSPNLGDAWALTFAREVKKRQNIVEIPRQTGTGDWQA